MSDALSPTRLAILQVFAEHGRLSPNDITSLAQHQGLRASDISRAISWLHEDGYIGWSRKEHYRDEFDAAMVELYNWSKNEWGPLNACSIRTF